MTNKTNKIKSSFLQFYLLLDRKLKINFFLALTIITLSVIFEMIALSSFIPFIFLFADPNYMPNDYILRILSVLNIEYNKENLFISISIFLLSLFIFKTIFLSFSAYYQNTFCYNIHTNISKKIFKIYLNNDYLFFVKNNSTILIRNSFTEVEKLIRGVVTPSLMILTEIFIVLGFSIILIVLEPFGFIFISIFFIFLLFIINKFSKKYLYVWGKKIQEYDGVRLKYLNESFNAIKEIKILGKENYFFTNYLNVLSKSNNIHKLVSTISVLPRYWIELILVICLFSLIFFMYMIGADFIKIISVLGIFTLAAFRLLPSVYRIINCIQSLGFNHPVIELMYNQLIESNIKDKKISLKKDINDNLKFEDKIVLNNLTFEYNKNSKIFNNFSLEIHKGDILGIIGQSGSGKTTLIDLILGLIKPQHGSIFVDGKNIHSNLREWHKKIGYVPQSSYLLDDSVSNNIALGINREEINNKKIDSILDQVQLKDFIKKLEKNKETIIGEKGSKISGGQRQRIAIARALYANSSIIIFDEPTNALDNETEKQVIKSIENISKDKTIIFISHNKDILYFCNKIYDISKKKYIK